MMGQKILCNNVLKITANNSVSRAFTTTSYKHSAERLCICVNATSIRLFSLLKK